MLYTPSDPAGQGGYVVSETPFMQMYWSDYFGDTRHLTCEQHGAYLQLIGTMWTAGGSLPSDPKKLAKITGCTAARWAKIAPDVMAFFITSGEVITHKRITYELKKAREKSIKRAEAGAKGGAAKSLKNNEPDLAIATGLLKHSPEPEPEPEYISSSPPKAREASFDQTEWGRRFDEAKEAAGDAADLTRPAMLHVRDLRMLVEPAHGEPCEWGEVLDAIRMVAARQTARGKQITTWAWVREDALALRDKRLSGVRDVQAVSTGPPSRLASFADQEASDKRKAWELAKSRMQNGQL